MALDTTKLKRRLPQPPTDGNPAMESGASGTLPARGGTPRSQPSNRNEAVPPTDGRSLRATGRTVQLNLKTSPATKARFLALAQARGVLMVDLFEEALDALEAQEAGR